MVTLRQFSALDAGVVREQMMPDAPMEEVLQTIQAWGSNAYQGKYFEMLALTVDDTIVGSVSLYAHTNRIASVGVEVFPGERGRGYATEGMRRIIETAKMRGYQVIQDQVRADNGASIALHEKLGFETDGYIYRNAKDRKVLIYLLCL